MNQTVAMRTLIRLCEAATPHGATYWYNPSTKQIVRASDHGDAVIQNPEAFGIDYDVQDQMEDAFPDEGGEEEEREVPDAPHPAELWGDRTGWHRNDAWETLAMNRGWVRVGEATSISAAYVSSSTAEAIWKAVDLLYKTGGLIDKVEIEIARPTNQVFTIIVGDDLRAFLRGGPRRAEAFVMAMK
jgi:hypothetical protein